MADALLTMELLRQPVAADGNGFGLFPPFCYRTICRRLPLVAATGLHKGSILGKLTELSS